MNKGNGIGKEAAFMSGCSGSQCSIASGEGKEVEEVVTRV